MKVLLINPPDLHSARISTGWDFEIGNIGFFPPYGLISLAAYIRKYRNHEICVLDCVAENISFERLGRYLIKFNPSVVGIGAFTYTFYDVLQTCRLVKDILPDAHVCIGGPHVILFPEETISHPEIDSLVLGDGEITFLHLLDYLEDSKRPDGIANIICRGNNTSQRSKWDISCIEDLDLLPFPSYDLIEGDHYSGTFGGGKKMACICSSRGCPYSCTFCQVLNKKYRAHSVSYIIDMMEQFYQQGYREFYFFDDLFNITAQRVIDISEGILLNNLKINWLFRGRVDRISEEMIKIASKSGCSHILLGIEDYTDEGLKRIKKGITIEQARKAIEWAHKHGLEVSTNWIIGLPSHKVPEDIENLVTTSIDIGSDYAQYTILQLLPGCEMFEESVNEGVIHRKSWSEYVKNPIPCYKIEPYSKHMNIDQLSRLYRFCHERFYLRSSFIFKQLIKIRNICEFKKMLKPALRIFLK